MVFSRITSVFGARWSWGVSRAVALSVCVAAFSPTAVVAKPGDLDPSFGNGGKVKKDLTGDAGEFTSVAIDTRGRIVAAGGPYSDERTPARFVLARYRSDGRLDPSFGEGGIANTDVPGDLSSHTIDRNGRIVAAGCTGGDFEVARFHSGGTPDDSFGHGGVVTTDFGNFDCASAVVIDSRGRIVAVGNRSGGRYGGWFAVARYTPDGTLDRSFSGDGITLTSFRDRALGAGATSAVVDSKNRIFAAGFTRSYDDFALVRYSPRGIVSARSFGTDGKVTTDLGAHERANTIAIDPEGRIVAAGVTYTTVPYTPSFGVARYHADGSLDRTFGGDGTVVTDARATATDVAVDSKGRIAAVGYTDNDTQCGPSQCGPKFAVARYLPDGRLDPAFGGDGIVVTDTGIGGWPYSVAIDSQDRVVVAGGDGGLYVLARYLGR
jgi:uncharacterized delta-60 repeat protein